MKIFNKIKLNIIAPYEEHIRNWYEEIRDRYYTVAEKADSIDFASAGYSEYCHNQADEMMADESDIILIIGKNSDKFYIDKYAKENGIPVEFINIEGLLELALL